MCENRGISPAVSLLTVLALSSSLVAAQPVDSADLVRKILEGARRYQSAIPRVAMDVEVAKFKADNADCQQEILIERLVKQYRRKGDHVDLASARYLPDGNGGFKDGNFRQRSIWNGQHALHRQGGDYYVRAYVSKRGGLLPTVLFGAETGTVLDGYLPHNIYEGTWPEVFEKELRHVTVRPGTEPVDGHPCHVLEADTRCGAYTLWVDGASGYCLRKAAIRLDNEDRAWGKPLSQCSAGKGHGQKRFFREVEITLADVVVEPMGELFMPTAGTYVCRTKYDDGYEMTVKRVVTRRNVVFHPDFEAMNAFQMDMPDGTVVLDQDMPGVLYQWFQGSMVPYLKEVMEESLVAQGDPQSAPATVARSANARRPQAETRRANATAAANVEQPRTRGGLLWALLLAAAVVVGIALGFAWIRTNRDMSREQGGEI